MIDKKYIITKVTGNGTSASTSHLSHHAAVAYLKPSGAEVLITCADDFFDANGRRYLASLSAWECDIAGHLLKQRDRKQQFAFICHGDCQHVVLDSVDDLLPELAKLRTAASSYIKYSVEEVAS